MSTSSNRVSSSTSGATGISRQCGGEMERGIPSTYRCREAYVIRTSKTFQNPGRLFHCCPNGSEKDKTHLFKWTDESMVEEIVDIKEIIGSYEKKIEELKAVVSGYEREVEAIKIVVRGCEKELSRMKNMLVYGGLGMVLVYYFFLA